MTVKHTPRPWSLLIDEARGRPRCLIVDTKGNEIASVNPYRDSLSRDAELIAAAPDLLAALQEVIDDGLKTNMDSWKQKANAAIAKAGL